MAGDHRSIRNDSGMATPARTARRTACLLAVLTPLSGLLMQCGSPTARDSASHQVARADSFNDRFQAVQTSVVQRGASAPRRTAVSANAPVRLASLPPQHDPVPGREARDITTLVGLKSSAFPYFGNSPHGSQPFLNVADGGRRGHRTARRVYWQDSTYNDNRTLIHIPKTFDAEKPGVIVLFFHGHGATLERDVRDRQQLPQQITESGMNAVLLAPQLAVDAADSSAGKFWQAGGLKRFMAESAEQLARLYGDPRAAKAFASMPVIIVGYSGGFVPTAWSLEVGGLGKRLRGVVLLDGLYGELDKFASWIASNRSGFFVSAYTQSTKRRNDELAQMLRDKGLAMADEMAGPLRPGSVVFVATPDGVRHRDYVTQAWARHPVSDLLGRMADAPAPTRVAAARTTAAR